MERRAVRIHMKRPHQNFLACVILHLLIPLTPLLLEFLYNNDIAKKSVVLAGAMYSFSISLASNQIITFAICLSIGFLMSASYGAVKSVATALPLYKYCWVYVIIFVFIINLIERFDRHVNREEFFFLFENKKFENKKEES
jgi:hypothetical protein